jgi:cold shock CspA family protein
MSQTSSESYVGQVKWFNNRLGYGFITIISECGRKNEDVFVHQQHIIPKTSEYRSLQQGEYVSFNLGKTDSEGESSKHDSQALNVTGVYGGTLMCDQVVRRTPVSHQNGETAQTPNPQHSTHRSSSFPQRNNTGTNAGRGRGRGNGRLRTGQDDS